MKNYSFKANFKSMQFGNTVNLYQIYLFSTNSTFFYSYRKEIDVNLEFLNVFVRRIEGNCFKINDYSPKTKLCEIKH